MIGQMKEIVKRIDFIDPESDVNRGNLINSRDRVLNSHPESKEFAKMVKGKIVELETILAPLDTRLEAGKEFEKLKNKKDRGQYYSGGDSVKMHSIQNLGSGRADTLMSQNARIDYFNTPQQLAE